MIDQKEMLLTVYRFTGSLEMKVHNFYPQIKYHWIEQMFPYKLSSMQTFKPAFIPVQVATTVVKISNVSQKILS
jgi:hypothetical protein